MSFCIKSTFTFKNILMLIYLYFDSSENLNAGLLLVYLYICIFTCVFLLCGMGTFSEVQDVSCVTAHSFITVSY